MTAALFYLFCAAFGWSASRAWFGFWASRERKWLRRHIGRVYRYTSPGDEP